MASAMFPKPIVQKLLTATSNQQLKAMIDCLLALLANLPAATVSSIPG
jgi:hypothetical protein